MSFSMFLSLMREVTREEFTFIARPELLVQVVRDVFQEYAEGGRISDTALQGAIAHCSAMYQKFSRQVS